MARNGNKIIVRYNIQRQKKIFNNNKIQLKQAPIFPVCLTYVYIYPDYIPLRIRSIKIAKKLFLNEYCYFIFVLFINCRVLVLYVPFNF